MNKEEALKKIKELEEFVRNYDDIKDDIFLLSIEEYEKYKHNIPHINNCWWLCSSGYIKLLAAIVFSNGSVCYSGDYIYDDYFAVRPALKYSSFKSKIVKSKDKDCFIFNEVKWKIIDFDNEIAIAVMPISFDKFDKDSNDYENSYIRKWLLNWIKEV